MHEGWILAYQEPSPSNQVNSQWDALCMINERSLDSMIIKSERAVHSHDIRA